MDRSMMCLFILDKSKNTPSAIILLMLPKRVAALLMLTSIYMTLWEGVTRLKQQMEINLTFQLQLLCGYKNLLKQFCKNLKSISTIAAQL